MTFEDFWIFLMSELDIIALEVPILLTVAVGWLIVRIRLLRASSADVLNTLFLHVFAPALIVSLLAKQQLASLLDIPFILATLLLMLGLYGGLFLAHAVLLKRTLAVSAFAAFAGTKFNTVVVGLPVLVANLGHHAIVPTIINLVAAYFTILPLTLILSGIPPSGSARGTAVWGVVLAAVKKAITHPFVVATVLGLFLAGTGAALPVWLDKTLLTVGSAAIPSALLAVGMALSAPSIRENLAEIAGVSAVRVILSPALAILVAKLFRLSPVFAIALVVSFSLPTAKMVLPLAEEHRTYVKESAGIIAVTTASLVAVVPVVIWVCERLWPGFVGAVALTGP
ncbi:MAG: AEC family transporter [Syntrophales bacterium]|nr:AEC family transporter [Syntrophales bacterium]MDD5641368.1 AEC family transporter [Syntrophales bacterium]